MGKNRGSMAFCRAKARAKHKANPKNKAVIGEGDHFANLPSSIITNHIMLQLPIKTLAICRLVCKTWNTLISDPYFARLHLQCAPLSAMIRSNGDRVSRTIYFLELETIESMARVNDLNQVPRTQLEMFERNRISCLKLGHAFKLPLERDSYFSRNFSMVVNSCNGLLCLCSPRENDLVICNPVTGEFIKLPKSKGIGKSLGILYDGLGFQPTTDEYKVVRIWRAYFTHEKLLFVQIHTLGKPGWRKVVVYNEFLTDGGYLQFPTCVNAALHWINFDGRERSRSILCFNFENERLHSIPSPLDGMLGLDHSSLAELGGFLYLSGGYNSGSCIMWVMKSYGVGESWTKVFNIDNLGINFGHYGFCYSLNQPENGENDFFTFDHFGTGSSGLCWPVKQVENGVSILIETNNSFLYYEPENSGYKLLRIIEAQSKSFEVIPHSPSLVSLKKVVNGVKVLNVHSRRFKFKFEEEEEVLFLKRELNPMHIEE